MAALNKEFFRESQPSQLALFELAPTQTAVENIYYQDVLPISQISGDSPVEFVVSGQNGMEYIDLKNTLLYVKAKIKKADDSEIADDENIGPVNLFLPALFNQVDVSKVSQLSTQLWIKDTDGHMNDNDVQSGNNLNLLNRARFFLGCKSCDMQGPIHHDLFKMDRYLLNQVKPEFCLMSNIANAKYKIVFEEVLLRVAKVRVNPAVVYAQSQALMSTNAKYPFTQTIVKQMTIPSGGTSFTYDNIFQDVRPYFITIGFVQATATTGNYGQNPWFFQDYNITRVGLFVDGISVDGAPLKLDYSSTRGQNTIGVLTNMFKTTGKWLNDSGIDIGRSDINKGYALYTFNLEPTFQDSEYLTLLKQGNVRLEVTFGTALADTISCMIYAEQPGYFEINSSRDIIQL